MSYDQCCKRWGEGCSFTSDTYTAKHLGQPGAHFCSEMVAGVGASHAGPCKCNCGATSFRETRAERRRREKGMP
jgi:hypothetical protein